MREERSSLVGGYTGKILDANLSNGKIETNSINEEDQRKFLGGSGLAAKIFFDFIPHRSLASLMLALFARSHAKG
jgi:aldehyde:ferredoxin oxidoreductase